MDKQFQFLIDDQNNFVQEENLVCIVNDGGTFEMVEASNTVLLQMRHTGCNINEELLPQTAQQDSVGSPEKVNWFHNAVLALINAFKRHKESAEGGIRSSQFYSRISNTLREQKFIFNAQQCKWKFASLKQKYLKYKDSQKAGNSGGVPINFKYSEEMDDIFGYSHSNGLPVPASSSRYHAIPIEDADNTQDEGSLVAPSAKRRRVTVAETIGDLRKETAQRHTEKMQKIETANNLARRQLDLQERALADHKELMLKLIEKL